MSSIEGQILGPSLWWLWELVIIFAIFFIKAMGPMGKIKAIRLQQRNGTWFAVSPSYVSLAKEKFSPRKDETHTVEMEAVSFIDKSLMGTNPVIFYNRTGTRPLKVYFEDVEHKPGVKVPQYNPSAADFDAYATRQGFMQLLKANAVGHPDMVMMILLAGIGFAAGFIIGPFVSPHMVNVPVCVGSGCPTTSTSYSFSTAHG